MDILEYGSHTRSARSVQRHMGGIRKLQGARDGTNFRPGTSRVSFSGHGRIQTLSARSHLPCRSARREGLATTQGQKEKRVAGSCK